MNKIIIFLMALLMVSMVSGALTTDNVLYLSGDASTLDYTTYGNPSGIGGHIDGALDFDGTDDALQTGTITPTQAMTWSGWFYLDDVEDDGRLFNGDDGSAKRDYYFTYHNDVLRINIKTSTNDWKSTDTSVPVSISNWFHLAIVRDGSNDVYIYKNGALAQTMGGVFTGQTWNTDADFVDLGGRFGTSVGNYNGKMDEIAIYGTALGLPEVEALYNAGVGTDEPDETDLIFHDSMDEVFDLTETGNDGEYNGGLAINTDGLLNSAFDLDGSNDYIELGSNLEDIASISAWVNLDTTATQHKILGNRPTAGDNAGAYFVIRTSIDGALQVLDDTGASSQHCYSQVLNWNTSQWYQIGFVINGSNSRFYRNGNLLTTGACAITDTISLTNSASGLTRIGIDQAGSEALGGKLDEVSFWTKQVTTLEMGALYNSGDGYNPYGTPPGVNYFTITTQPDGFNVSMTDGVDTYINSTLNGTITTDIPNNASLTYNITISTDYFSRTFEDVNLNSDFSALSQITINATDNETGLYIDTFEVSAYVGTYNTANVSTTSSNAVFNTTKGVEHTYFIDAPGYSLTNVTYTTNDSTGSYTFILYPVNTIDFNIYDQLTGSLITENISITFAGAEYYLYSTTTGTYRARNLTAGSYNISFNNDNWSINTYALNLSPRSYMTLNAYLIESEYNSVFTFKDIDTGEILSGVTFAVSRDILGVPTLIQTLSSDITGRIKLYYTPDVEYSFVASLSDYENKGFGLNPVIFANYNVWLTADATGSDDVSDYAGVNVEISPSVYYNDLNNTIEVLFYAPDGNLQAYNFTATYKTTSVSDTGLNAYGDLLYSILEIKNASITDRVKLSYSYQLSTGSWKTYTDYYLIQNGDEATGTHGANIGETYGMTLLERVLILMFIIGLVAGILYLVAGIEASGVISFALLGYFAYIGFVTPWIIIPSMIFLFIGIAWRVAT